MYNRINGYLSTAPDFLKTAFVRADVQLVGQVARPRMLVVAVFAENVGALRRATPIHFIGGVDSVSGFFRVRL